MRTMPRWLEIAAGSFVNWLPVVRAASKQEKQTNKQASKQTNNMQASNQARSKQQGRQAGRQASKKTNKQTSLPPGLPPTLPPRVFRHARRFSKRFSYKIATNYLTHGPSMKTSFNSCFWTRPFCTEHLLPDPRWPQVSASRIRLVPSNTHCAITELPMKTHHSQTGHGRLFVL